MINTVSAHPAEPRVFKMTAEFMTDVGELLRFVAADRVEAEAPFRGANVVVTITNPRDPEVTGPEAFLDLPSLRERCNRLIDGHVMAQTVAPIADYTGRRDFTL